MKEQWEYKILKITTSQKMEVYKISDTSIGSEKKYYGKPMEFYLNDYGRESWEVVSLLRSETLSIQSTYIVNYLLLKRKITEQS